MTDEHPNSGSGVTYTNPNSESITPTDTLPLGTVLAVPALLAGFFVALSYPLYALSVAVAVVVGGRLLRRGLAALVARSRDHVRELSLPGGTVRFRITPR